MPLYSLPLNKAVLIFFPPIDDDCTDPTEQQSSQAQVVQVLIKQDGKSTLNDIAKFLLVQQDITTAVEKILTAHIMSPLPQSLTVEGEGYSLHGEHKPWTYGKQIQFKLGTQGICAAEDKWVFVFDPTPGPGNVR